MGFTCSHCGKAIYYSALWKEWKHENGEASCALAPRATPKK